MHESNADPTLYAERHLPEPTREHWPEDARSVRRLLEPDAGDRPAVLVGGGEHLRAGAIGARPFDAIRTGRFSGIVALDRNSNVVRVRAGTGWGELRRALRGRGRTLARYGLHPEGATVGGLLARRQPLEKQLFTGDLREGCVALTTATPGSGDYEYIPAPRKASGPDHRYLHIGGEGFGGVILEASLVVWPVGAARLLEHRAEDVGAAVSVYRRLVGLDLRFSWCHWSRETRRLEAALHGPEEVVAGFERRVRGELEGEFELRGAGAVRERRRSLEDGHPEGRSAAGAHRRLRAWWNLDELGDRLAGLGDRVEEVAVDRWSRRRAGVRLMLRETGEPGDEEAEPLRRALAVRRVVDEGAAEWPEWTSRLKGQLDPHRRLAVGPEPAVD